jgi:hypothetical protein
LNCWYCRIAGESAASTPAGAGSDLLTGGVSFFSDSVEVGVLTANSPKLGNCANNGKPTSRGRHLVPGHLVPGEVRCPPIGAAAMKVLLNVGSGLNRELPPYFHGWRHDRLDIDPAMRPDVLLDARQLSTLPAATYDAVYCSHNLEHYFRHDAARVARGFAHVLKPEGFADVRVPDMGLLMRHVAAKDLDMDDVLYESPWGPIRVRDVIYGFQPEIERSGQEFFAHRNGFTEASLAKLFTDVGFTGIVTGKRPPFDLFALVFKQMPTAEQLAQLRVSVKGITTP